MPGLNEGTKKPREKSKELSLTQHWLAAAWYSNSASPFDAAAVAKRAASKVQGTSAIPASLLCSSSCSSFTYLSPSSGSPAASPSSSSASVSSSSPHLPSSSLFAACFQKTGNVPRPTKKGKSLSNAATSKQKKEAVSKGKGMAAVLPKVERREMHQKKNRSFRYHRTSPWRPTPP